MKSPWLNAVVLAVALAVSACGPTDETQEQEQGNVEQMLPQCDENGVCPEGFYCVGGRPFGACRRGIEPLLYPCTDEGLCPKGYYCDSNVCRRGVVEPLLYPCTADGRCPTGYYCDGSACRRELAAQ
ncbi:hypothetical protein [Archangium violaceum]|uniref:hypothetical protein n=1 Tax=Archangium violaceum TaxID=83451 RepID=UPI0036DC784B